MKSFLDHTESIPFDGVIELSGCFFLQEDDIKLIIEKIDRQKYFTPIPFK